MTSLAPRPNETYLYPTAGVHPAASETGRWVVAEAPVRAPGYRLDRDARRSDALALTLRAAVEELSSPLARAAAAFVEAEGWHELGFARLEDHARERLGRSGRWVRDLAALGRSLDALPWLGEALLGADGGPPLGRVAARLIGQVATAESLVDWISLARTVCVRELKAAVREHSSVCAAPDTNDDEERVLVRLAVPSAVRAALDEAVELYRAVEGHESSIASFVEALLAEAATGPDAPQSHPEIHVGSVRYVQLCAQAELALANSTGRWRHLEPPLRRLRELSREAGTGDAVDLDRQIRELIFLEDELELQLGTLLAQMGETEAWSRLRFRGAGHYAEERLGLCRTAARDRIRAARLLRRLPMVREAYESGRIGMQAALHIGRILLDGGTAEVDEATQRLWVERAAEATIKRMRDEARALARGGAGAGRPGTPQVPMDDAGWHASLHRAPGTTRERISRLGALAAATPLSDVFLGLRLPAELADALIAALRAARDRIAGNSGAPLWVGLLALIEEFVETWDQTPERKGQAIYERDGYRCAAPGCTSRRNLEDHHVLYRSRGGGNERDNRICICRFHHQRGEHGGLASCRGEAPLGVTWRLGRDGAGGSFMNERRAQ